MLKNLGTEVKIVQMSEYEIEDRIIRAMEKYEMQKKNKENDYNENDPILFNKRQAAKKLSISYNTLIKRIKTGVIIARSDGKIPKSSIDFYLSKK